MRRLLSSLTQFGLFNPCFLLAGFACLWIGLFVDTSRPQFTLPDGPVELIGWVASPVQISGDGRYFELRPLQVTSAGQELGGYPGRVAVYIPPQSNARHDAATLEPTVQLLFGDVIRIRNDLEDPRFYAVPGVPDYREVLWTRGVLHVVHLKSALQISRVGVYPPTRPLRPVFRYGVAFERFCFRAFKTSNLTLVLSLFLGRDKSLDNLDTNAIRRLGILHIFVVSGSHISLLLVCLHFALRRLGRSGRILTLAGVWFYVLLVGLSPPVVRSALMATVFYLFVAFGVSKSFMNVLGISALALLVVSPRVLASSGFQLSYLSLCAIGLFVMPLHSSLTAVAGGIRDLFSDQVCVGRDAASLLRRRTRYRIEQAINFWPRPPTWLCVGASRATLYTLGISMCSWFVQLLILPVTLWYSNMWIWTQWFTNLALIPLFGALIPLYLVLFVSYWTPAGPFLAGLVGLYSDWLLGLLTWLDGFCLVTYLPHPRSFQVWTFLLLFPALYLGLFRRWRSLAYLVPVSLFFGLWTATPQQPPPGTLVVTMLDVGQGDCFHLTYPSGRSALVDTGGSSEAARRDFIGEKVVARYLWENRISALDFVLLSHAHRDHIGGLDFLRVAFPIGQVYHGPRDRIIDPGISLAAGDRLEMDRVRMQVLHPPASIVCSDGNDESLVLLVTYHDFGLLLTGDIGKAIELPLLPSVPHVDILKAAHHGSRNSNTREFLQKAAPRLAIISAGRWNPFGHPSPVTLARLDDLGIDWLATPDSGSIRIETDGHEWHASVWDLDEQRFRVVRSGPASSGHEKLRSPNSPNPFLSSTFLSK